MDQSGYCIQVSHTATNNIVTNNIFVNCDREGMVVGFLTVSGVADYVTISNNIVANNGSLVGLGGITVNSSGCGSHNIYANNLVYGNKGGDYRFLSCTDTATGKQTGTNSTTFANYTGTISGDYHLKSGTSAEGTGTTACASPSSSCQR